MCRRQHAGRRFAAALGAIDETELAHGATYVVVGVPTAAAEELRLEPVRPKPGRLLPDSSGGIAARRARVTGTRPVRVQAERRACGDRARTREPALLVLL